MKRWLGVSMLFFGMLLVNNGIGEANMTLENNKVCYVFDARTGYPQRIEHKQTGTVFALDSAAGFDVTVDTNTGDIWETKPFAPWIKTLSPKQSDGVVIKKTAEDTLNTQAVYPVGEGKVTVSRTYTLSPDDTKLTVTMQISNEAPGSAVLMAQPLALYGIEDAGHDWSLLWPWHEGEIHGGEVTRMASGTAEAREAGYPVPFSMQYMAMFSAGESLYFGVHDANADHKNFFFRPHAQDQVALGGTQWPYVAPGETKTLAPAVIALQAEGGWEPAADRYRDFIGNDTNWTRKLAPIAENFVGWYPYTMSMYPSQYKASYVKDAPAGGLVTMAQVSAMAKNKGDIPMVLFLGWHEYGFDARYPDYKFDEQLGGEEGFRQAAEAIHTNGGQIMMYMNNHVADSLSEWYQQPSADGNPVGEDCAIRTAEGGMYHEQYWTGLDYVAMCPAAQPWIDANAAAVRRLRENGTDAIWLDQMMEMPSALCYNRNHGHDTPATAFPQGYAKMMQTFNAVMEEGGNANYLYGCEGVCDAYIQWIDISALMWMRLLGFAPESAPEITRYTLPAKILGLPGHGAFGKGEYARAFLMGEPILTRDTINAVVKEYAALYRKYPDIYLTGRYEGQRGLAELPGTLQAGVMLGSGGNRAAVQLFNPGTDAVTETIRFAAEGDIVSVQDGFTGEDVQAGAGGFTVTVKPNETAAVIIEWKGTRAND